ncbi:hypothetical protein BY996DRAFT_4574176 [Phakopsora pachyrhizi]|uniref:Uncharacterized protein n=1 Tax=Phakopsora pachyrhizi TaxID=170000 RepID=A0AAV0AJ27_PHAPC|nr:hypothetical protein BY996DRAFT_4574176 [Phakopsora pachyrhizi]CAH7668006.1 hypothetical protein PPACK8108_LOCUS2463 [Phakopsora pachyrhizi]
MPPQSNPENESGSGPQSEGRVIEGTAALEDGTPGYPPPAWTESAAIGNGPLPSLIFAIPFPEPISQLQRVKKTPPFLLYSLPRADYKKPPKDENGKRGKEGFIKKVERKWQEEIREGQDIKRGKMQDPSSWKRFKGAVLRSASRGLKWLPDSNVETLSRLPPGKKIGNITIVYPHELDELNGSGVERQPAEIKNGLDAILRRTRKHAIIKTTLAGCLLPVTAAIDFFVIVPLFLFEINIAYFALQVNGIRKVGTIAKVNKKLAKKNKTIKATKIGSKTSFRRRSKALKKSNSKLFGISKRGSQSQETTPLRQSEEESTSLQQSQIADAPDIFKVEKSRPGVFQPAIAHLYSVCSLKNPKAFPPRFDVEHLITPLRPDRAMVTDLIDAFKDWVPTEIAMRHNLDPDEVARDLGRCMQKGANEYIRSLKRSKN